MMPAMLWILIAGWALLVALVIGLSFLLLVGQAFGRRPGRFTRALIATSIGPGLRFADGNPYLLLPMMWILWTAIGAGVIVAVQYLR